MPCCIMLLLLHISFMTRGALEYAKEGYTVQSVLKFIIQHTTLTDTILVVAQPQGQSEPAQSVRTYLNAPIGGSRKNVFIEPLIDSSLKLDKVERSDMVNFLAITDGKRFNNINDKNSIRCILFFENMHERFFLNHPEIDVSKFQRSEVGRFNIYLLP